MSGSLERAILPRLDALENAVRELRAGLVPHRAVPVGTVGARMMEKADELYLGSDFSEKLHDALVEAGFDTNEKVRKANEDELRAVRGIGPAMLRRIRLAVQL